jgi:type II secretory pathway pseudopilin PulG
MKQEQGFTTIELLISLTILFLIVEAVGVFLWASQRDWEAADRQVEVLQNARIALDSVVRDVRSAQWFEAVDTEVDRGRLCYVVVRPDGVEELREVRADGQSLLLRVGLPTKRLCTFAPGSEVDVLADEVTSFRLTALDEGNSPIRNPGPGQLDKIRSVRVQVTVQDPEGTVPQVVLLSQAARRADGVAK